MTSITAAQNDVVQQMIDQGTASHTITPEATDTYVLTQTSGDVTMTFHHLTRESILHGIQDWADQTLLWEDDLDPELTAGWVTAARAVQDNDWSKVNLQDEDREIMSYVLDAAVNFL